MSSVRVRFAPSPTGGLHLGGVRTALYNYLFARQNGGQFILRIEDTDQGRYVAGAEAYIMKCLEWCGLKPDESPESGGAYGPYRQSERKDMYGAYARQLIEAGKAYYAFDTPEELETMRGEFKTTTNPTPQYGHSTRMKMRNSLSLPAAEVERLLQQNTPYVIRMKMPSAATVTVQDMIRGEVQFDTGLVDDKVLLKADGMPTYHLAVVVDDYLMKISHVFRGEEWLPSAPVHVLLWEYLGWKEYMPQWAHLPLILKPDGHGKLSKRDGERLGFPVFAMNWTDPQTGVEADGFKERGFLPEAFLNVLALLGWNSGTEEEIFTPAQLVERFSVDRIHKAGARFDYEKAKWFNGQHLQLKTEEELLSLVMPFIQSKGASPSPAFLEEVIRLIKERCQLLTDFWEHGHFFFQAPDSWDITAIRTKWKESLSLFFKDWLEKIVILEDWTADMLSDCFTEVMQQHGLKKGDVLLPLRIMLVGGKYGPGVFEIAALIGRKETEARVRVVLDLLA